MSQTDISISFVIPVLNGQKYMADCIEHIQREMRSQDEIIVVDNGSTDATLEILARYERVKVLSAPHITIGAARNRGAAQAKGEVLAFVDSDCLVCEGWRAAAVEVLADSSVAATGSRCGLPEPARWIEKAWYSNKRHMAGPAKYINSGNLVVRKTAFNAVSGFDEHLITDEDCDIGQRFRDSGYVVWEDPQVSVIHLGNPKSLLHFFRKEKWHAASSLNSVLNGKWDKPTLMTALFLCCWVGAIALVPKAAVNYLVIIAILAIIGAVPLVTAGFRVWQYRNFEYFFQLVVLYFLFYVSRSSIILKFVYKSFVPWTKPSNRSGQ